MCLKNLYKTSSSRHLDRSSYVLAMAGRRPLFATPVATEAGLPTSGLLRDQTTVIEQGHPGSPSPYRGENSMQSKAMQ